MKLDDIGKEFDKARLELETASLRTIADNESDRRLYLGEVSTAKIDARNKALVEKAVARFDGINWLISRRELELAEQARTVQRPLALSGDPPKMLVALQYDTRARELVTLAEVSRVVEEIRLNFVLPDYASSLAEWSRIKWKDQGPRSKLGPEFNQVVEEFQKAIGLLDVNTEVEGLSKLRDLITNRRALAESLIFGVSEMDRQESERMGIDLESFLQIKSNRLKKQEERNAAFAAQQSVRQEFFGNTPTVIQKT